jgi:hypothetical protein
MAKFLTTLDIRLKGYKKWETLSEFRYESDVDGLVVVPAEFITDLASVPRWPLAYLIAGDRAPAAAVLHDWLYQSPDFDKRVLADAIMLEAMGVHQPELGFEAENIVIRQMMYRSVRLMGWHAWRKHRQRAKELNPEWTAEGWPDTPPVVESP